MFNLIQYLLAYEKRFLSEYVAIPVQIAFRKALEQTGSLAMNSASLDWATQERFDNGTRGSLDAIPETSESTFVIKEQQLKFGARLALTSVNTWELLR